jgi:hypothetical protein
MRRLDLKPDKKLRNPERHLRQLARWPGEIVAILPEGPTGLRFWNAKVPVTSKLIEPPHATPETQRACLAALFAAAAAIEASDRRPPRSRVAVIAATPFMLSSEVTIFFDDEYFSTFLPPEESSRTLFEGGWIEAEEADASLLDPILPPAPDGLAFKGGIHMLQSDIELGPEPVESWTWVWAFDRH